MAFRRARAFSTFSSAAPRPASLVATENSVMGSPTACARTADRRTACMERDVPSVQMKKPRFFTLPSRATSAEQGDNIVTCCTMPEPNTALKFPRQRDGSPKIMRL